MTVLSHEHWMRLVLQESEEALRRGELPIAALVVAGDVEVARDRAADFCTGNRSSHAELRALTTSNLNVYRKTPTTLYCTLEPCVMCAAAILIEGVARVVYALDAPDDGGSFVFDNPVIRQRCLGAPAPAVVSGVMQAEAAELFRRYMDKHPDRTYTIAFAEAVLRASGREVDR